MPAEVKRPQDNTFGDMYEKIRRGSLTGRVCANFPISQHGISFDEIVPCEVCSCDCKGCEGTPWLIAEGFNQTDYKLVAAEFDLGTKPLPEIGACDALGGIAVCPDCWIAEETY